MDHILSLLLLRDYFIDAQKEPFFNQNILAQVRIIFEEMTDELNKSLFNLDFDVARVN